MKTYWKIYRHGEYILSTARVPGTVDEPSADYYSTRGTLRERFRGFDGYHLVRVTVHLKQKQDADTVPA